MPQMAPISWLALFISFSIVFILFNMINYFSIMPKTPRSSKSDTYTTNSPLWKW